MRAAGITAAQWTVVQVQVQRYAADKHVSERALSAVCIKMGIELARGHRFTPASNPADAKRVSANLGLAEAELAKHRP